jgi:hypothetical protein
MSRYQPQQVPRFDWGQGEKSVTADLECVDACEHRSFPKRIPIVSYLQRKLASTSPHFVI